jgi:hypothetical protein
MSTADQLLLERGELDALEYLLALDYLGYAEYRDWRYRRRPELQSALKVPVEEVTAALAQAQSYVAAQGLIAERCTPRAWNEGQGPLFLGPSSTLTELCSNLLVRAQDRLQGDLFQDSARAICIQAVRTAIAEHRFDAADAALMRLSEISDTQVLIDGYRRLIHAAEPRSGVPSERLRELEEEVGPLAARHLGTRARDYMAQLWTGLAERLQNHPFAPASPKLHASYAYAQAADWARAAAAIEAEADAGRQPLLVVRMAEAYARQSNREAARRAWTRLSWEHPQTAAQVLADAPGDPRIARLWREFVNAELELAPEDFPAWLLIADLAQKSHVPPALAAEDRTGRVYGAVHRLVSSDGDMSARVALHALRPDLLKVFLERRTRPKSA